MEEVTQLVFVDALEDADDGREEVDVEGEDGEEGTYSDGHKKMVIVPGDAVDASAVGSKSQLDG